MVELPEDNQYSDDTLSSEDYPGEYVSGSQYQESLKNLQPIQAAKANWQQKFAVVFLGLFGVSAVILWIMQFSSGLQVTQPLTAEELAQMQQQKTAQTDALRNQDTDKDGLSDYDESYLYGTSPYLEDSDSDGIGDKQEIDTGSDPNCPSGQDCTGSATDTTDTSGDTGQNDVSAPSQDSVSSVDNGTINAPAEDAAAPSTETDPARAAMEAVLGGQADAANLRTLLRNAGMSGDMLDQISDQQLLDMYQQTLKSQP
jgi:hypothetical protein